MLSAANISASIKKCLNLECTYELGIPFHSISKYSEFLVFCLRLFKE